MKTVELSALKRNDSGKKASASLRREGRVPAIMYGGSTEQMLSVESKELYKTFSGEDGKSIVVDLNFDGGDKKHVVLQEIQYHPINDTLIHADFLEIDINKPFRANVAVELQGVPEGVKLKSGNLRFHLRTLHLESLPAKMPVSIPVDVTKLDINDSIILSDIAIPEGVTKLDDSKMRVVSVAPPKMGPGGDEAKEDAEGETTATPVAEEKPAD